MEPENKTPVQTLKWNLQNRLSKAVADKNKAERERDIQVMFYLEHKSECEALKFALEQVAIAFPDAK